jgi:hypothetical protein
LRWRRRAALRLLRLTFKLLCWLANCKDSCSIHIARRFCRMAFRLSNSACKTCTNNGQRWPPKRGSKNEASNKAAFVGLPCNPPHPPTPPGGLHFLLLTTTHYD